MSLDPRTLVALAGIARPDVDAGMVEVLLQAAIKDVCRTTFLARMTQDYTITASTNSITVALSSAELLRVEGVFWKDSTDTTQTWYTLTPISYLEAEDTELWKVTGSRPESFSQQGPIVLIYPTPGVQGTIRVISSYVPSTDVSSVPLPELARQAVLDRAESYILRIPGQFANLAMATQKERLFIARCSGLRAVAEHGEVGETEAITPSLYRV